LCYHTLSQPIVLELGDITQDGVIDIFDMVLVGNHMGCEDYPPGTPEYECYYDCPLCDVNFDGEVNILDLTIVGANFDLDIYSYPQYLTAACGM